jgi:hypothetical protein
MNNAILSPARRQKWGCGMEVDLVLGKLDRGEINRAQAALDLLQLGVSQHRAVDLIVGRNRREV